MNGKFTLPSNTLLGNPLVTDYSQLNAVLWFLYYENEEVACFLPEKLFPHVAPTESNQEPCELPPDNVSPPRCPTALEVEEAILFLEGKIDAYSYMLGKITEDPERVFRILSANNLEMSIIEKIFDTYDLPLPRLPADM